MRIYLRWNAFYVYYLPSKFQQNWKRTFQEKRNRYFRWRFVPLILNFTFKPIRLRHAVKTKICRTKFNFASFGHMKVLFIFDQSLFTEWIYLVRSKSCLALKVDCWTSCLYRHMGKLWPKIGVFGPYFSVFWP